MFGNMLLSKEICNFPASPETIDKTLCLVLISGSCHKQNVYFCRCITLGSNPAGLNLNLRHSTAHTQIETWKWWPVLIALMRGDFLGSPPDKFILFRHYAHRDTHTDCVAKTNFFQLNPEKKQWGVVSVLTFLASRNHRHLTSKFQKGLSPHWLCVQSASTSLPTTTAASIHTPTSIHENYEMCYFASFVRIDCR